MQKIYRRYSVANGCMSVVGKKMGITRAWVSKLLERGFLYGFYGGYLKKGCPGPREEYTKEFLAEKLAGRSDFASLAKELCLAPNSLGLLLRYHDIKYFELRDVKRLYEDYMGVSRLIGRPPTSLDLLDNSLWIQIFHGICDLWGDISTFRGAYGLPTPAKPSWRPWQ